MQEEQIGKILHHATGPGGNIQVVETILGEQVILVTKPNEEESCTPTNHINFGEMKLTNLEEVTNELAQNPNATLKTYRVTKIRGPKAIAFIYENKETENRFGKLIQRGKAPLKFNLARIDLDAMKAKTPEQALRKAAFHSGKLSLLQTK